MSRQKRYANHKYMIGDDGTHVVVTCSRCASTSTSLDEYEALVQIDRLPCAYAEVLADGSIGPATR